MFDIGFSEVLLIFVIALVVLGPEKLPRAASQVGRWVGRARAMARQFKEQLEEEVNLENVRKAHKDAAAKEEAASKDTASGGAAAAGAAGTVATSGDPGTHSHAGAESQTGTAAPDGVQPHDAMQAVGGGYSGPDPADFRADTFSHAHPTNEYGANPLTANGAAPEEPTPLAADTHPSPTSGSTWKSSAPAPSASVTSETETSPDTTHRTDSTDAYAPATTLTPPLAANEPVHEPAQATPTQSDNHGHS